MGRERGMLKGTAAFLGKRFALPKGSGRISLSTLIWSIVSVACIGLTVSASWGVWNARQRAIERATINSQNLTRVLKQHTERMIDSLDMLLKLVSRELGPDATDIARQSAANATLAY